MTQAIALRWYLRQFLCLFLLCESWLTVFFGNPLGPSRCCVGSFTTQGPGPGCETKEKSYIVQEKDWIYWDSVNVLIYNVTITQTILSHFSKCCWQTWDNTNVTKSLLGYVLKLSLDVTMEFQPAISVTWVWLRYACVHIYLRADNVANSFRHGLQSNGLFQFLRKICMRNWKTFYKPTQKEVTRHTPNGIQATPLS